MAAITPEHELLLGIADLLVSIDIRLSRIEILLTVQGKAIMSDLTALTTEVQNTEGAEASVITLLEGVVAQIKAAGTDQAKLDALTTSLAAERAALAAAVAAVSTPAAPAPPASGDPNAPPASTAAT